VSAERGKNFRRGGSSTELRHSSDPFSIETAAILFFIQIVRERRHACVWRVWHAGPERGRRALVPRVMFSCQPALWCYICKLDFVDLLSHFNMYIDMYIYSMFMSIIM
jgi:hypothetical protein